MSSQETRGASSSRGAAIPQEATTGTGNPGNQIEDVSIALGQPTAGDFKLEFFKEIDDPKGFYKVLVLGTCGAPQHDLPNPPVPDLDSDLYKKIVAEIIDQFYEERFQELEDDVPGGLLAAYSTDDDDSSYVL